MKQTEEITFENHVICMTWKDDGVIGWELKNKETSSPEANQAGFRYSERKDFEKALRKMNE